jgi:hypothetical protein
MRSRRRGSSRASGSGLGHSTATSTMRGGGNGGEVSIHLRKRVQVSPVVPLRPLRHDDHNYYYYNVRGILISENFLLPQLPSLLILFIFTYPARSRWPLPAAVRSNKWSSWHPDLPFYGYATVALTAISSIRSVEEDDGSADLHHHQVTVTIAAHPSVVM